MGMIVVSGEAVCSFGSGGRRQTASPVREKVKLGEVPESVAT